MNKKIGNKVQESAKDTMHKIKKGTKKGTEKKQLRSKKKG